MVKGLYDGSYPSDNTAFPAVSTTVLKLNSQKDAERHVKSTVNGPFAKKMEPSKKGRVEPRSREDREMLEMELLPLIPKKSQTPALIKD